MADRDEDRERVEPDVEIGASVKAKSLRFKSKPKDVKVDFPGDAEEEGSHSERENLPDEVEPGVTYRDVRVRWRASGRIRER